MQILAEAVQKLGQINQTAHGKILENQFEFDLNTVQQNQGISVSMQVMFDGPALASEQQHGRALFPHKTNDDIYGFIALKVKGNATDAVTQLKALLEGLGLSEEMISQFATLEFKPYENEILIGFHPSDESILGFITPFLINPVWLKGDGTQDLKLEGVLQLASSFHDMLNDDKSVIEHLLKGISWTGKSRLYETSRDIILKDISDHWQTYKPLIEAHPYLSLILLYNKVKGSLEFQADEELIG